MEKTVKDHRKNLEVTLNKVLSGHKFEVSLDENTEVRVSRVVAKLPGGRAHPLKGLLSSKAYDIFIDGVRQMDCTLPSCELDIYESSLHYNLVLSRVCKHLKIPDVDLFQDKGEPAK